jgi:FAD/FMN-containing dehydrogenase
VMVLMHPRLGAARCALLAVRDFDAAVEVLRGAAEALCAGLLSFEAMWPGYHAYVTKTCGLASPFDGGHGLYLLIEAAIEAEAFESCLARLQERGIILDAVIAQSHQERQKLWALREAPAEFPRLLPGLVAFDVSLPLGEMRRGVARLENAIRARWPEAAALFYGHVADSNLHLIVQIPGAGAEVKAEVERLVYSAVAADRGSISAEHGIGRLKRPHLGLTRSAAELALMATVKRALDPEGILNPGRILPG